MEATRQCEHNKNYSKHVSGHQRPKNGEVGQHILCYSSSQSVSISPTLAAQTTVVRARLSIGVVVSIIGFVLKMCRNMSMRRGSTHHQSNRNFPPKQQPTRNSHLVVPLSLRNYVVVCFGSDRLEKQIMVESIYHILLKTQGAQAVYSLIYIYTFQVCFSNVVRYM